MGKIWPLHIRLFPELRILDDEKTQLGVLQRSHRWRRTIALACAWVPFMWLCIAVFAWPVSYWLEPYPLLNLLSFPVIAILITSLWLAFFFYIWRRTARPDIRRAIREMGYDICLHCGYDLRGLSENRCPECGREFEPVAAPSTTDSE